jgi:hypothetical protein
MTYVRDYLSQPWRFSLRHVRLNSGGYDSSGAYWGAGAPLYAYDAEPLDAQPRQAECPSGPLRAASRADAKAQLITRFPNARFYR